MRQITYISSAHHNASPNLFADVERVSVRNNGRDDLSGLLLYDGVRFLQVIEGEAAQLEQTLARIKADPRHHAFVMLNDKHIEQRSFGGWAMLCRESGTAEASVVDRLRPYLATADRSTCALFESFAAIRDAA